MNEYLPEQIAEMIKNACKDNFIVEIKHRDDSYDSHDVYYFLKSDPAQHVGYGFIGKKDNPDQSIALVRCPGCRRENYARNVLSGFCTWCPFDANEKVPS